MRHSSGSLLLLPLLWCGPLTGVAAAADDPPGKTSAVVKSPLEIEALIDQLVGLDAADAGLSSVTTSNDFPPIGGQGHWETMVSFPEKQQRSAALLQLVQAGPSALPAVLKHLDDARPTKLEVKHGSFMGGMWFDREVPHPSWAGELETTALKDLSPEELLSHTNGSLESYTVTVGDVCFVIAGMITGRPYHAVRYQPTACIVLNSPVHNPEIAVAVRSCWSSATAADLKRWLLDDLAHGDPGAAMRLLYYFPGDSTDAVAAKIKKGIGKKSFPLDDWARRLSWCAEPKIRGPLREAVVHSQEPEVVAAGAAALGDEREMILQLSLKWRGREDDPERGAAKALLAQALTAGPERIGATLKTFLDGADAPSREAALSLFAEDVPPVTAAPAIVPLLKDRDPASGSYVTDGDGVHQTVQLSQYTRYRICDLAYEAICRTLGDAQVRSTGGDVAMDARISALQDRLEKTQWEPFSASEVTARQQDRNRVARTRSDELARIAATHPDLVHDSLLKLDSSVLTDEDKDRALSIFYRIPGQEQAENAGPALNFLLYREESDALLLAGLDADVQNQVLNRLAALLDERMRKAAAAHTYPGEELGLLLLAARVYRPEFFAAQFRALGDLMQANVEQGVQEDLWMGRNGFWKVIDQLLDERSPERVQWFSSLCRHFRKDPGHWSDWGTVIFEVFGRHAQLPVVQQLAAEFYLPKDSPWHPSRIKDVGQIAFPGSLGLPAVRDSVKAALDDPKNRERTIGTVTLSHFTPETVGYELHGFSLSGSAGEPVDEGEPTGAKPGGKPMPVRQVDAILHALAEHAHADGAPAFLLYWPKEKRNEAILQWSDYLSRPPAGKGK